MKFQFFSLFLAPFLKFSNLARQHSSPSSSSSVSTHLSPLMASSSSSAFSSVKLQPPNSILGVAQQCREDTSSNKIDLTIGAYRCNNGKPYVLPSVRQAEELILKQNLDHEYLTQDGIPAFLQQTQLLLFGADAPAIQEKRIYSIQGLSGTGSLRLAIEFFVSSMSDRAIIGPAVTWPNHPAMMKAGHVANYGTYRYLDHTGYQLDFNGLLEDLNNAADGTIVLLHSCAHNPSGVDPSDDQWRQILEVVKRKNLFPFFDNAYQGFVSGSPDKDAFAVRLFADAGVELVCACSFAKNFGLYGERAGVLHIVSSSPEPLPAIASQFRMISRTLYSTCPAFGARIVTTILSDPTLSAQWKEECRLMAERLLTVRQKLYDTLVALNVKGTWNHVIAQRGMFSYTGIPANVVELLKSKYHIYMLSDGRISLAGLNSFNVERFAHALLDLLGTNDE